MNFMHLFAIQIKQEKAEAIQRKREEAERKARRGEIDPTHEFTFFIVGQVERILLSISSII